MDIRKEHSEPQFLLLQSIEGTFQTEAEHAGKTECFLGGKLLSPIDSYYYYDKEDDICWIWDYQVVGTIDKFSETVFYNILS